MKIRFSKIHFVFEAPGLFEEGRGRGEDFYLETEGLLCPYHLPFQNRHQIVRMFSSLSPLPLLFPLKLHLSYLLVREISNLLFLSPRPKT